MKKYYAYILLPFLLLSLYSCGEKPKALGDEDDIFVLANESDYKYFLPVLDSVFGKIIYTPQPEKSFNLIRKNLSQIDEIKNLKNILILAPFNGEKPLVISTVLKDNELSQAGNKYIFKKYNVWADEQMVMVFTGVDKTRLRKTISDSAVSLLAGYQKFSNKRILKNLYYDRTEKKDIEAKLLKEYDFTIFIQENIKIVNEDPANKLIRLSIVPNDKVERNIFIKWKDAASPEFLSPDSIIRERNRITREFLTAGGKHTLVSKEYSTTTEVNFNGVYALATQGLWKLNDNSKGGPFLNYTFFDEKQKRIYMLDGTIYAPEYFKKNFIQQVDILLQTFSSESRLPEKRKQELQKYL